MQTMKETAANVAAAAKLGMERMSADSPIEKTTPENPAATAGGSYSYSTTGEEGQSTGSHEMSALPGHGTGEPTGQVVEGTIKSHPIGKATGTGRPTTAHNTHGNGGRGYSG
ncbi:hypothetical protein C2S52_005134 [Perilla frutescens var. hirtella]|nr:hypothetical protein C2S51_010494 [Perilla frutescens var. frutescens]KAH6794657.1 hypothetical protein C2S52_005134 [Perilla frutescens var. hirtella]